MTVSLFRCFAAALALAVSASGHAEAVLDGLQDPGFGIAGRTIVDVPAHFENGEYLDDIVVAPSGTIYLGGGYFSAGRFVIARLDRNGLQNMSFGTGGLAKDRPAGDSDSPHHMGAMAVALDGKPLAAGWALTGNNADVVLCRYNVAGNLDASFGGDGCVRHALDRVAGGSETVQDLLVLPDGKFLLAGTVETPDYHDPGSSALLMRLNSDGSIDTGFGVNGLRVLNVGGGSTAANSVVRAPDGSIFVGGVFLPFDDDGNHQRFVAKYNANGALLGAFSGDGVVELGFDDYDANEDTSDLIGQVLLDSQGRIYSCGPSRTHNPTLVVASAARFLPDGQLDPAFGDGGRIYRTFNDLYNVSYVNGCVLQDDRLVMAMHAGHTGPDDNFSMALMRFLEDGSTDPSFGNGGSMEYPIDLGGQGHEVNARVALQGEHLLVAASASPGDFLDAEYSFAVARAVQDAVFADGFED